MIEELHLPLRGLQTVESALDISARCFLPVAHSVLRNQAEAEDVVQDTFVRVIEHRHKLPAIRDLRVWLVRITWNLALDRCRRIRPEQMDDLFSASLVSARPADKAS